MTTLRTDRNDRYFVAPGNRVAVFLAVTASAHINEPSHRGLRGSTENPESFPGAAESAESPGPVVFHVTPLAAGRRPADLLWAGPSDEAGER